LKEAGRVVYARNQTRGGNYRTSLHAETSTILKALKLGKLNKKKIILFSSSVFIMITLFPDHFHVFYVSMKF